MAQRAGDTAMRGKIFEHEGYVVFCEPDRLADGRYVGQALVRSSADECGRGFYALVHARTWARSWIDFNLTGNDPSG